MGDFHGSEHEDRILLGYDTAHFHTQVPTFWSNLPPSYA
jgi:hypothetical protein